jgi:NAD+ diphosphatase
MPLLAARNALTFQPIDRQAHRRGDAAWLDSVARDGKARYLPTGIGTVAVHQGRLQYSTIAVPNAIFLGLRGEIAFFACPVEDTAPGMVELRGAALDLPHDEASLAAYAVGLVRWHSRHGFCGVCGHPTASGESGHKRTCTNPVCAADHFPRTDPAIIVLVEHGDSCFLAHNAKYRAGMHSTLAGFVEPGESLEAAIEREVWEEAGIRLSGLQYHSSQPWPFPASLMVGYFAQAASRDFTLDNIEIVDGGWFTRDYLSGALALPPDNPDFNLPGRLSISRRLIEDWIDRTY